MLAVGSIIECMDHAQSQWSNNGLRSTMSNDFLFTLACVFVGCVLLGVLKTRRWKAVLVSLIVVWAMRVSQTEIELWTKGTIESYGWLAFLTLATWIPTIVVSAIGADVGTAIIQHFMPDQPEETAAVDAPVAMEDAEDAEAEA